jgi:hypothetical protein
MPIGAVATGLCGPILCKAVWSSPSSMFFQPHTPPSTVCLPQQTPTLHQCTTITYHSVFALQRSACKFQLSVCCSAGQWPGIPLPTSALVGRVRQARPRETNGVASSNSDLTSLGARGLEKERHRKSLQ